MFNDVLLTYKGSNWLLHCEPSLGSAAFIQMGNKLPPSSIRGAGFVSGNLCEFCDR
jgi:hypothetical protein